MDDGDGGGARPTRARTERGLDRLVNFTDATVAIAITVLVLPLVDLAGDIAHESFGRLVGDNAGALIAYTVTFFVIARLWVTHHRIFEVVADYDRGLVRWSILWLFAIVTLPFAANVLSGLDHVDDRGVIAFYIGTILAATVTIVGTEVHLSRRPALVRDDAPTMDLTGGFVMIGLVTLALAVAVAVPAVNLWAMFILLLSEPVTRLVRRVAVRRAL